MSIDFKNFPGKFTRLVLGGGGPRGLAILGLLHYIHENNGLDHIDEYWGTSVGSFIALLLSIGYTPLDAFHEFFMLKHFADPSALDIQSIIEETAFCPIELFGKKVAHFIEKKLGQGANPTFQDLYLEFGKKINIIGTNTTTISEECFNVDTCPNMKVIDAVEISCDLPYVFTKKVYNDSIYIDGGFINNFPINLADDGIHYTLGICVFGDMTTYGNDYIGWIYRLMHIPIITLHRERVSKLSDKCTVVELNVDNISIIEMSPNYKKKIEVFSGGYQQGRRKLLEMEKMHCERKRRLAYSPENDPEWGWGWETELDYSELNEL